ncbi:histidine kinase [Nostoc linckia]|nr:histidine kinase [Nostoc linckia]
MRETREIGRQGSRGENLPLCPMPNAQCPMPHTPYPMTNDKY